MRLEGGETREKNRPHIGMHFVTAGLSGIVASAMTQPLDVIKTRLQTQQILGSGRGSVKYCGLLSTARDMYHEEGPRAFFRGTVPRMVFAAPSAAMCWGTYEVVKKLLSTA